MLFPSNFFGPTGQELLCLYGLGTQHAQTCPDVSMDYSVPRNEKQSFHVSALCCPNFDKCLKGYFSSPLHDLLLNHPSKKYLQKVVNLQSQDLASLKLMTAPEKIQTVLPFSFLGFSIAKYILSLTLKLNTKDEYILIELQK